MIGGWYVCAIDASTAVEGREYTALVAGPFATYADADKAGPAAVKHVNGNSAADPSKLMWGVAEFYFHRLVCGSRNPDLWITPNPIERR